MLLKADFNLHLYYYDFRFHSDGVPFILDVCNDPNLLEKLAGLTELQETVNELEIWDFDDSQSVASMEMT